MRLFVAIPFAGDVQARLAAASGEMARRGARGNFTVADNLHLTLVFVGETDRTEDIQRAMDAVDVSSFSMAIARAGRFKRSGGDVLWAGVEAGPALYNLQAGLEQALRTAGFALEERPYKPHVTLGRKMKFTKGFNEGAFSALLPPIAVEVAGISLLESRREDGRLVYPEVYHRRFV